MKSDQKIPSTKNGAEPSVGFSPIPVVIFLLIGVLFYGGQLYLDHYAGGFNSHVYEPYKSWKMVDDLQPKGAGDVLFAKGKKTYDAACAACHQATGLGAAGVAPPLAGSEWVLAPGAHRVIRIVQMGLTGPVIVKGAQFNLTMPSMGRDLGLSDEDLAAVVTYIRGNKEWGNNASPVTPEEVHAVREEMKDRATQWTAEELQAIPEK